MISPDHFSGTVGGVANLEERQEQCQQVQDERLPWLAPALKKGSIGSETSVKPGALFDGGIGERS